jgi:hypothetical protein
MAAYCEAKGLRRKKIDRARGQEYRCKRNGVPERVDEQQSESGTEDQQHQSDGDRHHPAGERQTPGKAEARVFLCDNDGFSHDLSPARTTRAPRARRCVRRGR